MGQVKWEEVWKPHCTTTHEKICSNEPKQECSTEYREECWTEQKQQCATQHQEECWNEIEEECVHEQDCSEPEPSYPSISGGSRHKRSISEEEEEDDEEEVDAMLRSALEDMSASDFLELTSDLSDDELNQLTEEAEDEARSDNTGVAVVDTKSRSKRSIILGTAIKKALVGAILPKKKKKAVKAKVLIGSQKKSGS